MLGDRKNMSLYLPRLGEAARMYARRAQQEGKKKIPLNIFIFQFNLHISFSYEYQKEWCVQ